MKNTVSKHPLIAFFIMAFLVSWIVVSPLLLNPALPVEPLQILGAFAGPSLSAIIITGLLEGRKGIGISFKRYVQWRVGLVWWLMVLFGILISLNAMATLFAGISVWLEFFSKNILLVLPNFLILQRKVRDSLTTHP